MNREVDYFLKIFNMLTEEEKKQVIDVVNSFYYQKP